LQGLWLTPAQAAEAPQLVLFHGHILTVDARDSEAQAIAVRDGKIIAVGSDHDILQLAGPATHRIDLHGRTATPGLIDSHAHIAEAGVDEMYHVRLGDVSSVSRGREKSAHGGGRPQARPMGAGRGMGRG
jgi:predicted amidohydrolase YtcJ